MKLLEKILVATDFSQSSGHAVQTAQALAKAFGSETILIHVIPKVPDSLVNLRSVRMGIRERIYNLSKELTKAGIRAVETVVEVGVAFDQIIQTSERLEVNVIVVGSGDRADGGASQLGVTPERLARKASKPVLVRDYLAPAAAASHVAWRFHEFRLSAETAPAAQGAQAVCVFVNDQVNRACLEILARLGVKLIALRCAGYNNVDLAAAKALGLAVVRVPAYSPHAVAEHTVGLLLTLNRKIHRAYNRVREHNFSLSGLVGCDLHGKTVGIVGTGKIGRIAAQIFRGFEASVIAHDPFPSPDWAVAHGIRYVNLDGLLATSDIVSLHLPLLPETHHLLNADTLARTKPGVFIVNTSRGKLIDTGALIAALKTGHVGGVALDVYEEEAGVFFEDLSGQVLHDDELSRLINFPNVLITAHQAFLTHEALGEIARVTTANLLNGETREAFLPGTTL